MIRFFSENPEGFLNALKNITPEKVGDFKIDEQDVKNSKMAFSLTKQRVNINSMYVYLL